MKTEFRNFTNKKIIKITFLCIHAILDAVIKRRGFMKKIVIAAVTASFLIAGCSSKNEQMDTVVINYDDVDHVEEASKDLEELAEQIKTQMENGWNVLSPASFDLPDIFEDPAYSLQTSIEDMDENGYQELAIGLTVDGIFQIYKLLTVTEDAKIETLFISSENSFMVKEGTVYAVYPESGEMPEEEESSAVENELDGYLAYGIYSFTNGSFVKLD